ncbi:glyoxalase [Paraburkholderia ginsengiterrae]|uniref:Glyoxalase n=1 Tax=Paraburkholderia ginsengiterrae TaxID=1462993 RepID=A0A1A9N7T5_9BURK|nr:VOC family protein [Paraburkholderia ginsengiterrae]OAJ57132.1 glyoxalase [Paraburkholderia ginsengiterrae]OAJ61357.1 glyoxalase [Paraburkholderia ginsengiterrae]
MFSHVVVGTNDLERAKQFYDAVLGTLGYGKGLLRAIGDYIYLSDNAVFIVTRPLDGRPATPANGGTIGFTCQSTEQVEALHAVALANGGKSVENPPGVRDTEAGPLYLAYVRDPDGNKLCALYRMPV